MVKKALLLLSFFFILIPVIIVSPILTLFSEPEETFNDIVIDAGDTYWDADNPIKNDATDAIDIYMEISERINEIFAKYGRLIRENEDFNVPLSYLFIPNILCGIENPTEEQIRKQIEILTEVTVITEYITDPKTLKDVVIEHEVKTMKPVEVYVRDFMEEYPYSEKLASISFKTIEGYINRYLHLTNYGSTISSEMLEQMKDGFIYPFNSIYPITARIGWYSPFGEKRWHSGTDFGAPCRTPIYNITDAVVIGVSRTSTDSIGGHFVKTKNNAGLIIGYYHLSEASPLKAGQQISAGDYIGDVGATGLATGCHLHLEVRDNGKELPVCQFIDCHE